LLDIHVGQRRTWRDNLAAQTDTFYTRDLGHWRRYGNINACDELSKPVAQVQKWKATGIPYYDHLVFWQTWVNSAIVQYHLLLIYRGIVAGFVSSYTIQVRGTKAA
jgi:hypothetical protein